jgi:hypothetical protein
MTERPIPSTRILTLSAIDLATRLVVCYFPTFHLNELLMRY